MLRRAIDILAREATGLAMRGTVHGRATGLLAQPAAGLLAQPSGAAVRKMSVGRPTVEL